ncbi:MAG: hypothetical protein JST67_09825 [Bacteroidetes bacterium]|nr:hypothetical protein [Bacteroidota bacterium]
MNTDDIQLIGKRISVLKTNDVVSFVIIPTAQNWKTHALFIWLFLWTVSGIVVAVNYFTISNPQAKILILVWLGFWAYFEFKISKTFIFKRFGKEKIWIKKDTLNYWRDVMGRGKQHHFELELVKDLQLVEKNKKNFFQFMNESFWVLGSENISFSYGTKEYKMGIQLREDDARELFKQIRYAIKNAN